MSKERYSKKIAETIEDFLKQDDWHFSFDDQRGIFKFGLCIHSRLKKINYIVHVKQDEYLVYAISPIGADEDDKEMIASMAEFVCRANYALKNGNFELDVRDGELRFKTYVDCDCCIPSNEVIRNSIYIPASMFERYGTGILDIIYDHSCAQDAVDRCEQRVESPSPTRPAAGNRPAEVVDAALARLAALFGDTTASTPLAPAQGDAEGTGFDPPGAEGGVA